MSSLHEKTAERSPPLSEPEGTAMTSASRPASSIERWAFSLPAQSSMQPKGRAAEVVHSKVCGSIFLNFIAASCEHGLRFVWCLALGVSRIASAFYAAFLDTEG